MGPSGLSFGPERTNHGPERADLGPEMGLGGMDLRMDGRLEIHPFVPQDIGPLGPLPKKLKNAKKALRERQKCKKRRPTNGLSD